MNYKYHKVEQELTNYIWTVLVLKYDSRLEFSNLPLFTKGMPALLCRIKNDDCQTTLYGQSVPDEEWRVENGSILIAFFFKPFAIGTTFKLSARKLKEKPVELNLWNAKKTMALDVQLLHAKSTKEKIKILNNFIFTQIQANQRECEVIQYATDKLMLATNPDVLSQILQELHLTERTFQRMFKTYLGITPNRYRRICQFYFAFSQLKDGYFDKQIDVAHASGYFDQSHYIRSFKEFTGITPNAYLQNGLIPKEK